MIRLTSINRKKVNPVAIRKDAVDLAGEAGSLPPKPFASMTDEQWEEHVKGLREAMANWNPGSFLTLEEAMEKLGIETEDATIQ